MVIYFDNNATTPVSPTVFEKMEPFLKDAFGNPNSIYELGVAARTAVEKARNQLAQNIGCLPTELTFTGSGTESDNQAILGVAFQAPAERRKIVISALEHSAVKKAAKWLSRFGFDTVVVPFIVEGGAVSLKPFEEVIDQKTALVSVMLAHNETGVIMPVAEIAELAHRFGAMMHIDAIQGFGKLPIDVKELGCDLLSLSAHKCHGPKGVGLLYSKRGLTIPSLVHGGPQENNRRAGTENVAGIVGFGQAALEADLSQVSHLMELRDLFERRLRESFGEKVAFPFSDLQRTPNTTSVQFIGKDANILLIKMDRNGLCASAGSACHSGSLSVSESLLQMGLSEKEAKATVRFSFSKFNSNSEVEMAIGVLKKIL